MSEQRPEIPLSTYEESVLRGREGDAADRLLAATERAERTGQHEDYVALNTANDAWKAARAWRRA